MIGITLRRSKRSPFESGLRTPVLIQWAGRTKACKTCNALVNTIDLDAHAAPSRRRGGWAG